MGLISSLVLASCAVYSHSTFSRWSGPAIFRGTGGTVRSVNGIDIWANGAPDRRFRLLGFLEQANLNDDSALAILANVTSDQSLVADAKKAGGDAIILVSANTQFLGYNASIDYGAAYAGPVSLAGPSNDECQPPSCRDQIPLSAVHKVRFPPSEALLCLFRFFCLTRSYC